MSGQETGWSRWDFVTGRARAPGKEEDLVSVYVPTVPNPTSGNMAFVLEDDVVETDMSVEDAMKLIFSGGMVLPETISMARMPRAPRREDSFRWKVRPRGVVGHVAQLRQRVTIVAC